MKFKNKTELLKFINNQLNITLENVVSPLNRNRNRLYCELNIHKERLILSLLHHFSIRYEKHIGTNYWIWIK